MDNEISTILANIIDRQTEYEKIQAAHEQILTNLVAGAEAIVDKMDKLEEGFHTRFDKIEDRQRFPVSHAIGILGVLVTIIGLALTGFAYYLHLSNKPYEMRMNLMEQRIYAFECNTDQRLREDDLDEKNDKERFAAIEGKAAEQESLNHHLHKTTNSELKVLHDDIEALKKIVYTKIGHD